ncbi:MAG: cellulase N-terminal Ig-like domain-containing protein, partial [Draconibacterium sp.]|nr:cellulase N-terminal Ig-like domain-containing protein [Draconibacterium sp.]
MRKDFIWIILFLIAGCTQNINVQNVDLDFHQVKAEKPTVTHIALVAPDVLGITIKEGYLQLREWKPYTKQTGDSVAYTRIHHNLVKERILYRNGEFVGHLGGKQENMLSIPEKILGDTLQNKNKLDNAASYSLVSENDANFKSAQKPKAVYLKSKINTWSNPVKQLSFVHTIYLHFPEHLKENHSYKIDISEFGCSTDMVEFTCSSQSTRSEAVHVSQVGFRPDDPVKKGYLSVWLGTGGAYSFKKVPEFEIINTETNEIVYSASAQKSLEKDGVEQIKESKNYSKTE